jgi:hypothetical protein
MFRHRVCWWPIAKSTCKKGCFRPRGGLVFGLNQSWSRSLPQTRTSSWSSDSNLSDYLQKIDDEIVPDRFPSPNIFESSQFSVNFSLHFNRQIWFSCVLTSPASSYYSASLNTRHPARPKYRGKGLGYNQAINNEKNIYYSNQPWLAVGRYFRFCCNYFWVQWEIKVVEKPHPLTLHESPWEEKHEQQHKWL